MILSPGMGTELWLRSPRNYIKEIVEAGQRRVVFDRGTLVKYSIDPVKFCELYFQQLSYRLLVVGSTNQGCAEYVSGSTFGEPISVYPIWSAEEDDLPTLEEMIQYPVGLNDEACSDASTPLDERPTFGQEHRIILTDIPNLTKGPSRRLIKQLSELQDEYPSVTLHLHGSYSWRAMFGLSFASVDYDGRTQASKGMVYLPNGKQMRYEMAANFPQWVSLLGMKPVDLSIPRNRCLYNIRSAGWASENYKENISFRVQGDHAPDTESPTADVVPAKASPNNKLAYQDGDKILCNTCSMAKSCKYYREGAVCSVPGEEVGELAKMFGTRDGEQIVDALGTVLAMQAGRLERGMQDEELMGELDPEVSKLMNSLFVNGVKLAKLRNPDLSGGTKVGVFVNGGQGGAIAVGQSPHQLAAAVVAQLEAKGIAREDITPEMVGDVLSEKNQLLLGEGE